MCSALTQQDPQTPTTMFACAMNQVPRPIVLAGLNNDHAPTHPQNVRRDPHRNNKSPSFPSASSSTSVCSSFCWLFLKGEEAVFCLLLLEGRREREIRHSRARRTCNTLRPAHRELNNTRSRLALAVSSNNLRIARHLAKFDAGSHESWSAE